MNAAIDMKGNNMNITNLEIFNKLGPFTITCPQEKNDKCMPIELNLLKKKIIMKYKDNHLLSFWFQENDTNELIKWLSEYNKRYEKSNINIDAFLITDIITEKCTRRICFVYLTYTRSRSKNQKISTMRIFYYNLERFFWEFNSSFEGTCYWDNSEISPIVVIFDLTGLNQNDGYQIFEKVSVFLRDYVDCTNSKFHKIIECTNASKKELNLIGCGHITHGFFIKYMPPSKCNILIELLPLMKDRIRISHYYHQKDKYAKLVCLGFCKPEYSKLSEKLRAEEKGYDWEQAFLFCRTNTLYIENILFQDQSKYQNEYRHKCLSMNSIISQMMNVYSINETSMITKQKMLMISMIIYNLIHLFGKDKEKMRTFILHDKTIENELFKNINQAIYELDQIGLEHFAQKFGEIINDIRESN